jgi:hypothetical protein
MWGGGPACGGSPSYVPLTLQSLRGPQSAQAKPEHRLGSLQAAKAKPKHSMGEGLRQTLRGTPPDDERRRLLQKDVVARPDPACSRAGALPRW